MRSLMDAEVQRTTAGVQPELPPPNQGCQDRLQRGHRLLESSLCSYRVVSQEIVDHAIDRLQPCRRTSTGLFSIFPAS